MVGLLDGFNLRDSLGGSTLDRSNGIPGSGQDWSCHDGHGESSGDGDEDGGELHCNRLSE